MSPPGEVPPGLGPPYPTGAPAEPGEPPAAPAYPPAAPAYPPAAPPPTAASLYPTPAEQPPPRALQGTLASSQTPAPAYQPPPGYGPAGYWTPGAGGPGQWRNRAFGRSAPPAGSVNGMAIASLILGLVGWVFFGFGSLLAVAFGVVGLRQLRTSDQNGRALAVAGIVLGSVSILVIVALLAAGFIVR